MLAEMSKTYIQDMADQQYFNAMNRPADLFCGAVGGEDEGHSVRK
jgi:hypothetical protein